MTQAEALTILKTGANAFLTGEPGSGKTHTINAYVEWLRASGIEPSVTAATGIAATHVGGMTLHSWSGIGIADRLSAADIDRIAQKEHVVRRLVKAKVLIIDEVSMLSSATFGAADAVCREVRKQPGPFGGLQVILVGDFFQLPPVSRNKDVQFAYESSTWRELNPLICYLHEQHRQEDDAYLAVLAAIRRNDVEELHYERLNERHSLAHAVPKDIPQLFSHNADVDRINNEQLAKLPGKARQYLMTSRGGDTIVEGLKRGCLSPELLELKEGAAVMFTKNNPQGRFVNGTLGTVSGFDGSGMPVVKTREGRVITTEPVEWQVEENGKVRASITQVPLRLAYAMTVHKSQGMSMDAAVVDLSKAFEYGQGYVALSRVRTLAGLHLLGINDRALQVHPEVVEKDADFRAASAAAEIAFSEMGQREVEQLQKQFVKAMGGAILSDEELAVTKQTAQAVAASGLVPRLAETLYAVRDADSLGDAARARGLSVSTIVKHLEELHESRQLARDDFIHLLSDPDALSEMREAWEAVGGDKLTPVFQALHGRYSFENIRLARLTLN